MARTIFVSALLLVAFTAISAQNNCPNVVSHRAWGGLTPGFVQTLQIRPAPYVIVHPTATESCSTIIECQPIIRDIQMFHMAGNWWPDISYHFLMGGDIQLYEGRGWGRRGFNVGDFSNQALNVGLIGTFATETPSEEHLQRLDELIACGIAQGHLASNVQVIAQCQVKPIVSCEGSTIFEWVREHPRFNANPRAV